MMASDMDRSITRVKPPTKRSEIKRLTLLGYGPEEIAREIQSTRASVWTVQSQLTAAGELPPRSLFLPPDVTEPAARRFWAEARERGLAPPVLLARLIESLAQHDLYRAVLED